MTVIKHKFSEIEIELGLLITFTCYHGFFGLTYCSLIVQEVKLTGFVSITIWSGSMIHTKIRKYLFYIIQNKTLF